jgi:hypothetical protein
MGDTRPGIGGESQAALRVIAHDGPPETNTTGLQRLGKGQCPQELAADDRLDETIVLGHEVIQAGRASCLGLPEQVIGHRTNRTSDQRGRYMHKAPPLKVETPYSRIG